VDPEEVEAGEETAEDGAYGVRAIKEAHPGNAFGRGFEPAGGGRERCAHQHGGRDQADGAEQSAEKDSGCTVSDYGDIGAVEQGEEH